MLAYLSVRGEEFAADELLSRHKEVKTSSVWRKGELNEIGKTRKNAGFTIAIGDGDRVSSEWLSMVQKLQLWAVPLAEARAMGAALDLVMGILVYADKPMNTIHLPSGLLQALAAQQIDIKVSGYACSDD